MMNGFKSIQFKNDKLILLDQTKLPLIEEYIETDDYERIATAIERLEIRGAPAIGVTAAYALALSVKAKNNNPEKMISEAYNRLASTRPTAVNLFWALDEMKRVFEENQSSPELYAILIKKAKNLHQDDIDKCLAIGKNGLEIFNKQSVVLTHCNTGQLATGGNGTAFHVIQNAFSKGMIKHVFADETRPLLQGSRLTAFELDKAGIPFSIITDSTAAFLMKQNKIDLVIVGADRIAGNGDTANKIGTYNLAVLCKYHGLPFYIAAPTTTIDSKCKTGEEIKIELRDKTEVTKIHGVQITCDEYDVFSPAFDITSNELITGIITEKTLHKPPYKFYV
ncbi:MAG: S-methyl-5-thioribose-1-phosphate isomerase [Ignavibacteria bacterium RBG_13_36_8]|nr:MAG: S-methyl-5-thioribose-1-phosphate isomerase [Ignavibacteria bacterium RBG_13_36_8]